MWFEWMLNGDLKSAPHERIPAKFELALSLGEC